MGCSGSIQSCRFPSTTHAKCARMQSSDDLSKNLSYKIPNTQITGPLAVIALSYNMHHRKIHDTESQIWVYFQSIRISVNRIQMRRKWSLFLNSSGILSGLPKLLIRKNREIILACFFLVSIFTYYDNFSSTYSWLST